MKELTNRRWDTFHHTSRTIDRWLDERRPREEGKGIRGGGGERGQLRFPSFLRIAPLVLGDEVERVLTNTWLPTAHDKIWNAREKEEGREDVSFEAAEGEGKERPHPLPPSSFARLTGVVLGL